MFLENTSKSINELEKFFKKIKDNLSDDDPETGDLFVFLGAGFSSMYKLPNWSKLVDKIIYSLIYHNEITKRDNYTEIQLYLYKLLNKDTNLKLKISFVEELFSIEEIPMKILYDILCEEIKINKPKEILKGVSVGEQELLKKLGNINAKFITTNFDNILQLTLGIKNQIVNFSEYINSRREGVIHIHGALSKANSDDFLEKITFNFESYVKKYNTTEIMKNNLFRTIIEIDDSKTNNTILFLGSSLQESEIIGHIAADSKFFSKKIALMGYTSKYDYKIESQYYKKKFGVEIIGYNSSKGHSIFGDFVKLMSAYLTVDVPTDTLDFIDEINKEIGGE